MSRNYVNDGIARKEKLWQDTKFTGRVQNMQTQDVGWSGETTSQSKWGEKANFVLLTRQPARDNSEY